MEVLQTLGAALGLGFLTGIRLYATVFLLGLAIRFQWFHLSGTFEHLHILADPRILAVAGVGGLLEFFADKVPWIDSLWDTVHTIVRPVGAVALSLTAFGDMDPAYRILLVLLSGTMALSSHSTKAATRFVANHSPEPVTNVALSLAEDVVAPAGLWLVASHPLVALGFVCVFIAIMAWLGPKIWRALRIQAGAVAALWRKHVKKVRGLGARGMDVRIDPVVFQIYGVHGDLTGSLPTEYRHYLLEQFPNAHIPPAIRCAATKSVPGLRGSIGYLCTIGRELVFVTQRNMRFRMFRVPFAAVQRVDFDNNILLDRLWLHEGERVVSFDVFKAPLETAPAEAVAAAGR